MGKNKAWVYESYGDAKSLKLSEYPLPPQLSDDEVLIEVKAAALNPVDYKRRNGYFPKSDTPFPVVPGHDVAGVVVEIGKGVKKFKKGDEVYGDISEYALTKPKQLGTLAQYTVADEKVLALKPNNVSFGEAASLPLAILTAQEAFERVNFKRGQSVLIIGGAGGVGSLAIQLAKEVYGASLVAATASTKKIELLKSLGADVAIDYTKTKYEEISTKFDFLFDTIGEIEKAGVVVKEGGRSVTIGVVVKEGGGSVTIASGDFFELTVNGDKLASLTSYVESGKIKAVIDPKSPFPFSQVVEAFEYLESGRATGKIVISPFP